MRILVIEDTKKHLNDGRQHSEQLVGCTVDFATTLAEAMELLQKNSYDGVISDVFFPAEAGASVETFENAIAVSTKLVEMGVHHVFNTSGNHHGSKYEGFTWKTPKATYTDDPKGNKYDFRTTGMIIEAYPENSEGDKDTKQWQAAFRYILLVQALLQLPDKGESIVKDAELHGFPYGEYGALTERFAKYSHPFVVETFQKFNA